MFTNSGIFDKICALVINYIITSEALILKIMAKHSLLTCIKANDSKSVVTDKVSPVFLKVLHIVILTLFKTFSQVGYKKRSGFSCT